MNSRNDILALVFEKSLELILMFHEDGTIFEANSSVKHHTRYGEDVYGINITRIFPTIFSIVDGKATVIAVVQEKIPNYESEILESYETVVYCTNQTCFPVLLNYEKKEIDGNMIGICLASNISERKKALRKQKKAMEEIKETTKIKNEFMTNVTHELRTPVNGIKGLASTLLDTNLTPEQLDALRTIIRSCDNMSKIINNLLDISKIEAGKFTIEKDKFCFEDFLHELLEAHAAMISGKGLQFHVYIGSGIPKKMIGDELRLGQIIHNLLSNAIKFTNMGSITIEVAKTNENENEVGLFFMIMDTGIGIAPKDMDKLFERFSQVDGSITRRFGGTGLGLFISRQLVELMGGTIHVKSELGRGSTFSFSVKLEIDNEEIIQDEIPGVKDLKEETFNKLPYEELSSSYKSKKEIVNENLEKLIICIEMGTWEKAEAFAGIIKRLMPPNEQELKKAAFRVVLSVRKMNYEESMQGIKKLQGLIN